MTELMDRQRLVGWIVRDSIINQGIPYTEAARRWPMALPTLNRLMNGGNVGLRFYRTAEHNLDLPSGLLELVIDGDGAKIAALTGLDARVKEYILTELGYEPPKRRRSSR